MAARRGDTKLLVVATVGVVVAGLLVAGAILLVTGRAKTPSLDGPVAFGTASTLRYTVNHGGPVPYAGTSGDTGFWLTLEHGRLVPVLVRQEALDACHVRWRGSRNTFTCGTRRVKSDQLARYRTMIPRRGGHRGVFYVDLRHVLPAPRPIGAG